MPAELTNLQKRILAKLARRAFTLGCARARGRGETPATDAAAFDAFRRREVAAACGKAGLRCCSQADYGLVKARLQTLLGESGEAFKTLVDDADNERRVAEYKLAAALHKAGLAFGYAETICRAQFKCTVGEASAKQLWCLMFTVQKRSQKSGIRSQNARCLAPNASSLIPC